MKNFIVSIFVKSILLIILIGIFIGVASLSSSTDNKKVLSELEKKESYWFLLHRKSNMEYLYKGVAGEKGESVLVRSFKVKVGAPGQSPTPLPKLLGKKYWVIIDKQSEENSETSPYFLTLNIPVSEEEPYGPIPYLECNGQCNWNIPGYFGLHGTGGNPAKLSKEDPGSSGCIRHLDEEITYLYNLLDPRKEEIRYYIEDI